MVTHAVGIWNAHFVLISEENIKVILFIHFKYLLVLSMCHLSETQPVRYHDMPFLLSTN